MNLTSVLNYVQVGIAVLMTVTILMQQRGSGLSGAIGGGSSMQYSTKRGVEKGVFTATIVLAAAFIIISIARVVLSV